MPYLIRIGHLTCKKIMITFFSSDAHRDIEIFFDVIFQTVEITIDGCSADLIVALNPWNVYNHTHIYIRTP